MRTRLALAALSAATLLPAASLAEELPTLIIPVGAMHIVGGDSGLCDDLSVATISLDAAAKVTALKVGTTLCSARVNGTRRVFRVQVVPAEEGKKPGPAKK